MAPRSPSPDLKNSRPYPEVIDPSVGPFAYEPNKDFVLVENPAWTIGEKRGGEGDPEQTAGPGEYDPANTNKVKGFTISPERQRPGGGQGVASPGPGGYDIGAADKQTKPRVPEIKFGDEKVIKRDTSADDIGPGTYGDS